MRSSASGRILTLLVVALAAAVFGSLTGRSWPYGPTRQARPRMSVAQTLKVLRSQQLAFFATDRIVTQVVVEKREDHPLLGTSECFLVGVVRYYHGLDLAKLSREAVKRDGDAVIVHVPEPKELDFGVDLESVRVISKRSGLIVIRDWASGRDHRRELRKDFAQAARAFLRREGLVPKRAEIIRRLNSYAPVLSAKLGAKVVFRW